MNARAVAAILAAGAGTGTFAALASLPPGFAAARPGLLVATVVRSPWFIAVAFVCCLLLGLLLRPGSRPERDDAGTPPALWPLIEPCVWGAAAPLLSLLLDPWFFHSTVYVVGLAGIGLGTLGCLARWRQAPAGAQLSDRQAVALLMALAVLIPTFLVLPGPPWFHAISGDEPHYLVIARSLWVDGDVDLANEYAQGLTQPFWDAELAEHAKPGVRPEERYSIHGSGLGVWLAPWYGLGRGLSGTSFNVLIRAAMSLWLAAAAAALFFLLRDIAGRRAALPGTALAVLTLPLLFAGPHLFPAVPVFALSCAAYVLLRRGATARQAAAAGMLLACLPWLHFKFFGLMAALATIGAWFILRRREHDGRGAAIAALGVPMLVSGVAHAAFTWSLYGRLSPLAIHVGADPTLRATAAGDDWAAYLTDPLGALTTGIGYFLDQREGLLFYAPHYLLALAGLSWMVRRRRADAIALTLALAALVGPYALSQEIGHWAPPARPLTGVLWTVAVAMGVGLLLPAGSGRRGSVRAALRAVLVTWGIGVTVLMLSQADLLYHDYNAGRALVLLRYGAPGLPLANMWPLWLGPEAVLWGVSLLGLALTVPVGIMLWRWGAEAAEHEDLAPAPPGRIATRAAAIFICVAAGLMLWHHARVPLSDLHQPWTYGTIRYWKAQSPPTRAWPTEEGVWTGGHDSVQMLLSSREPLDLIVLEVTALAPMQADIQLGRDRQSLRLVPGERAFARLQPGPARRWNGEYFYHLNVIARSGISRAALGIDDDTRGLGVFLEVVQVQSDTP